MPTPLGRHASRIGGSRSRRVQSATLIAPYRAYPRGVRGVGQCPVAACDGTRSALRPSRGSDRRLEGEPAEGSRSGRPAVTVAVEAPAMAAECGDRRKAHGRSARKSWPAAACSGAQNRRHAGAARRPRGPLQGSQRALSRGPSGRPGRVCRGRRKTGPRVAARRPRTRRTLRAICPQGCWCWLNVLRRPSASTMTAGDQPPVAVISRSECAAR
jgi:hypothetical protein